MSADCVLDANVGIKLFLIEPLSDRADALFDHLAAIPPAAFYVPDLFFIECTNILWKYVRNFDYPREVARRDITDLIHLPLHVVSTVALAEEALQLAMAADISAYDAAYVALAETLGCVLFTCDQRLAKSPVHAASVEVL